MIQARLCRGKKVFQLEGFASILDQEERWVM